MSTATHTHMYPPIGTPDAMRPVIVDVAPNGSIGARLCAVIEPPAVPYPQPVRWLTCTGPVAWEKDP